MLLCKNTPVHLRLWKYREIWKSTQESSNTGLGKATGLFGIAIVTCLYVTNGPNDDHVVMPAMYDEVKGVLLSCDHSYLSPKPTKLP